VAVNDPFDQGVVVCARSFANFEASLRPSTPARRVILLGASNLTRSFPTVVATVRQTWSEPVEIMAAMGHGRSYGQDSSVFGKKISGIFPCALWQDLQNRQPLPTAALVTDIGNDMLYGVSPNQMLDWVERCLDRLAEAGATTIVTQLPAESIERLGERRFQFFRRLLFARSKLTLADVRVLVREINERLVVIGQKRKIPVISASRSWYGFDPIHIRRSVMRDAWPALLATWREINEPVLSSPSSLSMIAYLSALEPRDYSRFGFQRHVMQPNGRLNDGTTISIY
jgi:hypothetical protein